MVDRTIVYSGSLPQSTDYMQVQRNSTIALGALVQAAFGTGTIVDGLACTQTTVPSMSVTVAAGSIMSLSTVDATAYGSLSSDSTPLVKMGINIAATTLTMTAPVSAGTSINYLVEASILETDGTPVVLPYYNAANPAAPYSGPSNSGTPQNTQRTQRVQLQLKAGTAATTGTQTTPAVDTGWTGLYVVTVAYAATTIVNGNIATLATAPFIPAKLGPGMLSGFSHVQAFTSSGNFTGPAGVTAMRVRVWGAGGGSGATWNAGTASQAGAGGGYAESLLTGLTPGTTYTVTVGTGGTAGAMSASPTAGGNGGTSSFGAFLSATGGNGGIASSSGSAPSVATAGAGTGGNVWSLPGNTGNAGFVLSSPTVVTSQGGASPFAGLGAHCGTISVTANGIPGLAPGGGAGGGANQSQGGAGAAGAVIVEW